MAVKNYLIVTKNIGEADTIIELNETRLHAWMKNGSLQDGDEVYEVVNKRKAMKQDIILVDVFRYQKRNDE